MVLKGEMSRVGGLAHGEKLEVPFNVYSIKKNDKRNF